MNTRLDTEYNLFFCLYNMNKCEVNCQPHKEPTVVKCYVSPNPWFCLPVLAGISEPVVESGDKT